MSVGPLSIVGSLAGGSLQQTQAADAQGQQARDQVRKAAALQHAEAAAGVGETEQDHETQERDADGRRPWEYPTRGSVENAAPEPEPISGVKDPSGQRGANLDLLG